MISGKSDHRIHEIRSLLIHRLVAKKLRENPKLIEKAWSNIAKAREVADLDVLKEWEAVLRAPISRICDFIVRDTQVAIRMRQSSPFHGIITPEERQEINEQIKLRTFDTCCFGHNG
ncbi:hypothetical protein DV532_27135 (plasmid) [Pseudomonas sp. Leaf58]|nr:hypothetical protein DV532_27135 [Pseudomonas sp. Leaf58]KQN62480.1 hypothetical protein ASF02_10040 [Pseudomonas sp. Leaf58]